MTELMNRVDALEAELACYWLADAIATGLPRRSALSRSGRPPLQLAAASVFTERIAMTVDCYHYASMRSILVRGVPDAVHATLAGRAERRGQSLQQYLVAELERLAARPDLDEVLDRIDRRRGGRVPLRDAAADVADERAAR